MPRMIATHEPPLVPISAKPLTIGQRFRRNVKRLMCEQNLSQSALADRLTDLGDPTEPNAIKALLNSASYPSTRWVELLSRAFGCEEWELLTG